MQKYILRISPFIKAHQNLIITILTLGVYILPILQDIIFRGWQRVFNYFAADSFYYLTVAKNFGHLGFFTFDGEFVTNGFHPLWQVLTGFIFKFSDVLNTSETINLLGVFLICVSMNAGALWLIAKAFIHARGSVPVWSITLPVGIYALLLAPFEMRFGTLWSFTNAMETPLLILGYSLLLWLASQKGFMESFRSATQAGLVLGFLTLARLDHGFIGIAFGFSMILQAYIKKSWRILGWGFWAGGIFSLVVGFYLATNMVTTGLWLPVSGSIKSTFPNPSGWNLKIDEIRLTLEHIGKPDFGTLIWRYTQIILPVIIAIPFFVVWIVRNLQKQADRLFNFWGFSAFFIILLGLYNFLYVPTYAQGHWYFPISILWMSLILIDQLSTIQFFNRFWLRVAFGLIVFVIGFYFLIYLRTTPNQRYASLYNERQIIQEHFAGQTPKIVEYDDGIIAFTTEFETLSGFGYCLDRAASIALTETRLLDLAYDRGYRYIASYYYFGNRISPNASQDEIHSYLESIAATTIHQTDLKDFIFSIEFMGVNNQLTILKMERQP